MKKNVLYALVALVMLAACTNDNESTLLPKKEGVEINSSDFVLETQVSPFATRSSLTWDYEGGKSVIRFAWNDGDRISVFSNTPTGFAQNIYEIRNGGEGKPNAYFDGNGFDLTKGMVYYGLTSYTNEIDDKTRIILSYANQRQTANNNSDHLGAYDYQVACTEAEGGFAQLNFKHLGAVLRFDFGWTAAQWTALAGEGKESLTFKSFELITADNYDFQYNRILDLTDGNAGVASYNPGLSLELPPCENDDHSHSFKLDLGPATTSAGITVEKNKLLTLFMMAPASTELVGKKIYGVLTLKDDDDNDNNDVKYYVGWNGVAFKPGAAVSLGGYAVESDKLTISISVDKAWQLGNTQNQTRAASQGDPGKDDVFTAPTHLYVYTCTKGTENYEYYSTTPVADIPEDQWIDNGSRFTYKQNISVDLDDRSGKDVKVYIIASNKAITTATTVSPLVKNTTLSTVLDAMTMTTTADEDLLKNLYSYTYELSKDAPSPIINAVLYHTAAKLDVQWNSASALPTTDDANDSDNADAIVKVSGLPDTGLKLFTPTENATGSWAPEHPITTATRWNGRTVFYVPQLETPTYNITVGTSSQNVPFTKIVNNNWTSWFKANITINPAP